MPTLQALGALYRTAERWSDLADMDLREAERIADPERRAARYYEVADLVERRLGDQPHAISLYERCLDLVPGHRAAFAALDHALSPRGALARHRRASTSDRRRPSATPKLVRYYKQEIGRLWRERVPNADKAAQAYREALAIDAARHRAAHPARHDARAGAALGGARRRAREARRAARREEPDKIATLHRLARVLETQLGQEERALAAHGRVLERRPTNETSLRAIGRLHYRAGRWLDVITSYGKQLPLATTPEEQAALYYRIGRVYERKLGRRDDALTAYEVSLDHDRRVSAGAARARSHPAARSLVAAAARGARQAGAHRANADGARATAPRARADLRAAPARSREGRARVCAGGEAVVAVRGGGGGAGARARGARAVPGARGAVHGPARANPDGGGARERLVAAGAAVRAAAAISRRARRSPIARRTKRRRWGSRCASPSCARLVSRAAAQRRCRRWRRSGARTSDKRLALGYRTLAAVRDEVSAQSAAGAAVVAALSRRGGAGAAGSRRRRRRRAHARARAGERRGGQGAAARRARRAGGAVRLGAGAGAHLVRGGLPVRSRRARARRGAGLRAGGQRGQRFSAGLARRAAYRRRQRAVVGGGGAVGARGRGRGRRRESRRRAARRRRDRAVEAERVAHGPASLQAAARAAAGARSRVQSRGGAVREARRLRGPARSAAIACGSDRRAGGAGGAVAPSGGADA